MIKLQPVPFELLASRQTRQQAGREAGVPLYLHAFEPTQLGDPAPTAASVAEADFGVSADGFADCYDEDDDFY